jgi:HK97 family phage prohead protease
MKRGLKYLAFDYEIESKSITEEGKFAGWASVFDKKVDAYGDIIASGAFSKSLGEGGRNKNGIPLLWQHYTDKPAGIWENLEEKKKGLWAEGIYALGTQIGNDAYILSKMGAVKGLSIGFDPYNSKYEVDEKKKIRTLTEIDLWEISVVTFPAKVNANITNVKSVQEAKTERELEEALRDSGLSKQAALYVVKLCRPSLRDSEEGNGEQGKGKIDLKSICESLTKINKELRRN